jgi:hypothetical protein
MWPCPVATALNCPLFFANGFSQFGWSADCPNSSRASSLENDATFKRI